MWSQKGVEVIFRVAWTGSFLPQDGRVGVTFSLVDTAGLYLPSIPIPSRGLCHSRPASVALYLGSVSSLGTPDPRQENLAGFLHGDLIPPPSGPMWVPPGCCR